MAMYKIWTRLDEFIFYNDNHYGIFFFFWKFFSSDGFALLFMTFKNINNWWASILLGYFMGHFSTLEILKPVSCRYCFISINFLFSLSKFRGLEVQFERKF